MRYVILRQEAYGQGVTPGMIVYVARLRKAAALGCALTDEVPVSVTDPRIEWAKTAGKCNHLSCSWDGHACVCETMQQARLMLREANRRNA